MAKKQPIALEIDALRHDEATRKNIPTAEHQSVMAKEEQNPIRVAYERRAAIFIGSEFGTVSRTDLVAAARDAGDADFDVLITCAFNYDAHSSEFNKLGRIPVLKARMNADLHMADGNACWFIDTDYNMESFFVRHAYFLGANDPYKALKTTLKAEINEDDWATLNSNMRRAL